MPIKAARPHEGFHNNIRQNESESVRKASLAAGRECISVARLTIFSISLYFFFKYIKNLNIITFILNSVSIKFKIIIFHFFIITWAFSSTLYNMEIFAFNKNPLSFVLFSIIGGFRLQNFGNLIFLQFAFFENSNSEINEKFRFELKFL